MTAKILTVHDRWEMGHEAFVRMTLKKQKRLDDMPSAVANVVVECRVDHGQWIVDCPFCPGAELLDPQDLRFFCLSCRNGQVGGLWLMVAAPSDEDRAAIEAELVQRPERFRHWNKTLTIADLQVENLVHAGW